MRKFLLLFSGIFDVGGIEAYNRHLCDALEAEFCDAEFIAVSINELRRNEFRHWRNIKIKFCGWVNLKVIKKILFTFKTILAVLIEKPQFLICAHVNFSPIALFFERIIGLEYAVLTHGIDVWDLRHGMKYSALKNAHIITAVSQYTKTKMVKNGIHEYKIRLLQDTIDTSLFHADDANQKLKNELKLNNKRVLLTVGRVSYAERYKGHDIMLKVMQELSGEYIWLVVGGGDDLTRLQRKAKEIGVISKVRFLGHVENDKLIDYYNLCDVFIMPSKGEGFGIVFLEAMACGKPVIGGNCDGSAEPLMDGKLGFLINPDNAEEIINAIKYACTTKEDRTNPEYLIKQIRENFGIGVFDKKVREIFRDCFALDIFNVKGSQ